MTEKLLLPLLTAIISSSPLLYGFIKFLPLLLQLIEVIGQLLVHSSLEVLTPQFTWFEVRIIFDYCIFQPFWFAGVLLILDLFYHSITTKL